jgi:glycosyltransferase involved in cell wall biosynthesis
MPFITSRQYARLYDRSSLSRNAIGIGLSAAARLRQLISAGRYDVLFIQREAALIGPPLFERVVSRLFRKPMVLDIDDPLWVHYESPVYGRLGSRVRCLGKTKELIKGAAHVICGNGFIAEYVSSLGSSATVLPTIVDTDSFSPKARPLTGAPPVIGWIGTHTTLPYLESISQALERLAERHRFRLKVVGGGRALKLRGVDVEEMSWSLNREVEDFRSLDIGLYPLSEDGWSRYKSGFKAIQYACCGVPFVASPVGIVREIAERSGAAFLAASQQDWFESLDKLLGDQSLRYGMGEAGRAYALRNFSLKDQAAKLGEILFSASTRRVSIRQDAASNW